METRSAPWSSVVEGLFLSARAGHAELYKFYEYSEVLFFHGGGDNNQDPRRAQKPVYTPVFTRHIRS